MGGQIAEAYVQIIPTTDGIASNIGKALGDEGEKGGKSLGKSILSGASKVLAAVGIGKVFKDALAAGGDIQQSFGGLDTIYDKAAEGAKNYARAAAEAGISANSYAEQAVSFGAALKQAYGGDTVAAMEAANTAIMDMADNSAKMGTDISAVQSAYQGFAKQNYTMLDNLKLGYGGTKTEMERLLADAEKLSGIHYDIDNLGDVYDAIHVIQQDLGLTGVAAEEAKTTLTGSMGAMKASFTNFLADLALGNDLKGSLSALTTSVIGFANNVIPLIGNIISAAPQAIVELLTGIGPTLLETGMDAIMQLGTGIAEALPDLIATISEMIPQIITGFAEMSPQLLGIGIDILLALINGILSALPQLIAALPTIITALTTALTSNIGLVVQAGITLLMGLVQAIPQIVSALVAAAPEIVTALIGALLSLSGELMSAAVTLWMGIVDAIVQLVGPIVSAVGNAIKSAINAVVSFAGRMLQAGVELIKSIISGIKSMVANVIAAAKEIGTKILDAIKGFVGQMVDAGRNLLLGLAQGIGNAIGGVIAKAKEAAGKIVGGVKSAFGIASPSRVFRDQVGRYLMLGLAAGIEGNTKPVTDAIDDIGALTTAGFANTLGVNAALGVTTDAEATADLATLIRIVNGLSDKIDRLKIYLDSGELVGGITGDMDDALGSKSALYERGLA